MNLLPPNRLWILLLVLLQTVTLQASNLDREKRWADQIIDSIMDGNAWYGGSSKLGSGGSTDPCGNDHAWLEHFIDPDTCFG